MIASITPEGYIVFDLDIQDPWDWIDMMRNCFPNCYIGCYNGYENSLFFDVGY